MEWKKPDPLSVPLNRPLLVKLKSGSYEVMYYHPKFNDRSQIPRKEFKAWVSISIDDFTYGDVRNFEWVPWKSVVSYFEFPF